MRRVLGTLSLVVVLSAPATAAWAEDSLAISSPAPGSVIRGIVTITVTAAPSTPSVSFDRSLDDGATWTAIATDWDGSNGWSATWNTHPLDGPIRLRAVAGDQEAAVAVTLDNPPRIAVARDPAWFSPNRDGVLDTTRLSARIDEPGRVSLSIVDASGSTRRRWTADLSARGTFAVTYNGRSPSGVRLRDGRYAVRASVVDLAGKVSHASTSVVSDTVRPRIVWSGVTPDPGNGSVTRTFSFSVRDADVRFRGSMRIRNTTREIASRSISLTKRTASVSWQPTRTLYIGTHRTSVRLIDRAGNRSAAAVRPWRVHRSMTGRVFNRLSDVGRTIALTFDDCYQGPAWRSILDTLRSRRLKASFFCPGETLASNPSLARRTVAAGHSVGSHGWDHSSLAGRSDTFIRSRLVADRNAWWKYGRSTSAPYFRPPYGAFDARVVRIAGETSMPRVMMWDVDPRDWTRPGTSALVSRVRANARGGSVILLHTIGPTARALPAILDALKARSLRPVTLDQMFAR